MSVEGRYFTWTLKAGQDLSDLRVGTGHIFKAVTLDTGRIANNGREAGGLLLYGGREGQHVTIGYAGIMRFTAGEDIPKGARLTVGQNGYCRIARPGNWIVGRCLDSEVMKGDVGTGTFNFATISFMTEEEGEVKLDLG